MANFIDRYFAPAFGGACIAVALFLAGSCVYVATGAARILRQETEIEIERNNAREIEYTDKLLKRYDTNSDGVLQIDELRMLISDGRWIKIE